ncbi:helix-turn-helix transcriptional regulator [Cytobacillus sp. Sa5YUA1]|uniref:Helix-turn-helix transcriptional regulator n=1 Tax=Cytobacillus stercorigallinarum TaxID=2762240 RepID=A0ABR8QV98_9BACI|nr:helix-turn-helix domain-containing protein [Cytobacillus stercorigallinarum]MBD7939467.1 helix-turn-helix transcriptional regulator [Cytobacillus stercorigallinarum]
MDEKDNKLGDYLKRLRKSNNYTLREAEAKTGVPNTYISNLENGKKKNPSMETLYKLSKGYKSSYTLLLSEAGYEDEVAKRQSRALDFFSNVDEILKGEIEVGKKQVDLIEQSKELYRNEISIPIYLNEDNEGNFYFFKDNELIDDETQQKLKNIIKTLLE